MRSLLQSVVIALILAAIAPSQVNGAASDCDESYKCQINVWNETRKEMVTLDFSSLCRGPGEPMYHITNASEGHDYVVNVCAPVSGTQGKCLPAQKMGDGGGTIGTWWETWRTPAMYGVATQKWGPQPTCDAATEQGPQCSDPTKPGPTGAPTAFPTGSPTVETLGKPTSAPTAPTPFPSWSFQPTTSPTAWSGADCAECTRPCAVLGLAGQYSVGPAWALRDPKRLDGGVAAVFQGVMPLPLEPFQCPFDVTTGGPAPRRTHYRFECDPTALEPKLVAAYQGSVGVCKGHPGASAFKTKAACEAEQAKWGCLLGVHEVGAPPCELAGKCLGANGAFSDLTTQEACEAQNKCTAGPDGKGLPCAKTTSSCQGWKGSHQYTTEDACTAASKCQGPKTGRGPACSGGDGAGGGDVGYTMAPFWGNDFGTTVPYWRATQTGVKLPYWQGCDGIVGSLVDHAPDGCCDYYLDFQTKAACGEPAKKKKAHTAAPASSSMSGGTLFCVVFFAIVGGYAILGMAFGKYQHGAFAHPHARGVRRGFHLLGDGFGFALNGCSLIRSKPTLATEDALQLTTMKQTKKSPSNFDDTEIGFMKKKTGRLEGIESASMLVADDQDQPGYSSI